MLFVFKRKLSDQSAAGPYDTFTPSQSSNDAESSLRPYLGYGSGRSSTYLRSPIYTSHSLSAAIHSQCSNSAWETDPSQSADDGDLRPIPDEGSASMQSYNDSRTGIWPQEDSYEHSAPYTNVADMDHDIGVLSSMIQPLPQVADADAAASLDVHSYSFQGDPLLHGGLGAERTLETAAPSFTSPSASQYSGPRYFYPSLHGRSGVSIVVDSTMDHGIPWAQQFVEVEQPLYPIGSDQSSLSNLAPNTTSDNPPFATASIDSTDSPAPAPAPSPSISAATSTSILERCPHSGCRAKFTGSSWKDSLRRHRTNAHEDRERPICSVCRTVFSPGRKDNLKRHVKSQHPGYQLPASRNVRSRRSAPRRQQRP